MKTFLLMGFCLGAQVDDKAVEDALGRFKAGIRSPNATARAAAVSELARTPHEKTLNRIGPLLVGDVKDVRVAAAKGLAGFGDFRKTVTPMLLAALPANSKEPEVRVAIFEALGKLADLNSLATVHKSFREDDARVAKASIACAGAMRLKDSMDPLLELQKDVQKWIKNKQSGGYKDEKGQQGDEGACAERLKQIQAEITKAFQTITREKWTTPLEWEIWWNRNRATFEVPK